MTCMGFVIIVEFVLIVHKQLIVGVQHIVIELEHHFLEHHGHQSQHPLILSRLDDRFQNQHLEPYQ